ncbi:DUF6461 domain-containing protein [Frankia sp. AiPa1]|uniref:DUF6461 domain-containing protein n=1 Tax=Frankia sp. AiPa1 TaxID=573492 RepID=UPI00202B9339|nr:DUF6461 domain-containing protein [Frankia sp. AiPa1]MCL9760145.1 DUF6461 domain-containing protein [Frankia sp. AiPa1]
MGVQLSVLAEPPSAEVVDRQERAYDEIVEVSWHTEAGFASVVGAPGVAVPGQLREQTPPWPGDYRMRVAARGRDDPAPDGPYPANESYELLVWPAPHAEPLVVRQTDRLGHRLRGQDEPAPPPHEKYRWVRGRTSVIREAATLTVVVGTGWEEVLRLFGAAPGGARSLHSLMDAPDRDSWLALLPVPGADVVIVMEENGFAGADGERVAALSRGGLAGSVFWNINAVTRLSLARAGRLLAAEEINESLVFEAGERALLDGIDLTRWEDRVPKGLLILERFTGHSLHPGDIDRLWNDSLAHRVRT